MHSFQNFIVRLILNHPPPLETRIWKLVVRALTISQIRRSYKNDSNIIFFRLLFIALHEKYDQFTGYIYFNAQETACCHACYLATEWRPF